jgi:nucleoid DNA-binding protein
VTKKEIVKTISDKIGMTQLKTKEIVQNTFQAIVDTLVEERRIELRNFGVFEVKQRAARKARNPRTGQRVDVPQKFVVTFKPGKQMEERVRQLEEAEEARLAQSEGQPGPRSTFELRNPRSERFHRSYPALPSTPTNPENTPETPKFVRAIPSEFQTRQPGPVCSVPVTAAAKDGAPRRRADKPERHPPLRRSSPT